MSLQYAIASTSQNSPHSISVLVTYEDECLATDCTIFARNSNLNGLTH